MAKVVVVSPPELSALIVYVVSSDFIVAVPLISPVVEFKFRPEGRLGVIVKEVTLPPLTVGNKEVIAWFLT